jgi:hypothetical protein
MTSMKMLQKYITQEEDIKFCFHFEANLLALHHRLDNLQCLTPIL